jgi:hypothetical protein
MKNRPNFMRGFIGFDLALRAEFRAPQAGLFASLCSKTGTREFLTTQFRCFFQKK